MELSKQITAAIPSDVNGPVSTKVLSPDGSVGYLISKELLDLKAGEHVVGFMHEINKTMGLISEANMLAGAIGLSTLIVPANDPVNFVRESVGLMTGESLINSKQFAILREHDSGDARDFELGAELLKVVHEDNLKAELSKYDDDDAVYVTSFQVLRGEVAWNFNTNEPYTLPLGKKKYLLPL
ncbi:hypothetical protein ACTG16_22620 [Aeromonas sp. 23P]|uniref:hypothetical protein n=1 Tax=Aeromonas sp. 23P TaxID=3452716 RepID=UPI003F7A5C6C|nr:hypothetical protein [Aeromonas veronii]